jgi:hypothetical protein
MEAKMAIRFCGARVSAEDLELIRGTIQDCGGLSRTELAHTICELLDWRRPNGRLKAHECRLFLEELAEEGILRLPGTRGKSQGAGSRSAAPPEDVEAAPVTLEGTLRDLGPLELELVETPEARRQWRDWVGRFHYLGCTVPFGAHLRYFVRTSRPEPRRVGCIQLSSPAWRMAPRDQWIGWDEKERVRGLQRIVQNSRFLLVPWVRVPHLASASLAGMARRVQGDWEAHYAVRPVLMETLVDSSRFKGTCYRAANWIHVGQTTGRGRMDRGHERHGASPKEVFVYPLCRGFREKLREASGARPVLGEVE